MKRLGALLGAASLTGALLAACAPEPATPDAPGAEIDAKVQAAARDAGLADCPSGGNGSSGKGDDLAGIDLLCVTSGEAVTLADFDGPVVVNVWAHWCEPCREELPLLARAAREYEGRVQFVGVLFADDNPADALALARDSEVTYPQVADRRSLLRVPLGLRGLPTTVFVDDGEIVGSQTTPYRDYGDLVDDIAEQLEVDQ